MAVQNATDRIGNRFVVVVAVYEHGKDAGDGAGTRTARPRAFKEAWQLDENGWSVTARNRRLSGSQCDFALCMREARQ